MHKEQLHSVEHKYVSSSTVNSNCLSVDSNKRILLTRRCSCGILVCSYKLFSTKEIESKQAVFLIPLFSVFLSSRISISSAIEPHWNIWAALITMQHRNPPWIFIAGPLRSREPLLSHMMCFRSTS